MANQTAKKVLDDAEERFSLLQKILALESQTDEWTEEQTHFHVSYSFNAAVRQHPDLMEPYVVALVEIGWMDEQVALMRRALAETSSVRLQETEFERVVRNRVMALRAH